MTEHTHPDYDRNFQRMVSILEQVTENVGRIAEAQALQAEAHAAFEKAMERLTTKSAETEDKLNALIDLVDRHLREHGK